MTERISGISFIKRVHRWVPDDGTVYVIKASPDFLIVSHSEITDEQAVSALNEWFKKEEERTALSALSSFPDSTKEPK